MADGTAAACARRKADCIPAKSRQKHPIADGLRLDQLSGSAHRPTGPASGRTDHGGRQIQRNPGRNQPLPRAGRRKGIEQSTSFYFRGFLFTTNHAAGVAREGYAYGYFLDTETAGLHRESGRFNII